LALQLLYQYELTGADPESMKQGFEEWSGASEDTRDFANSLLLGVLDKLDEIDRELELQTAHWRLDRLAAVDRNILRLAMYELLYHVDTPHAVVIDEAIEVAKKFGAAESSKFVNGVLDGFVKRKSEAI
jgi:N utilization substance protein B